MNVKHAVIMAAGLSSRFAPLSYEKPKALFEVRGEILIERQIEQLMESGVPSIVIVTGYKSDMFTYLADKYHVKLIFNETYDTRNNHGSLYAARDYLSDTYICSADNYFTVNPFERDVSGSYYSVVYAEGETDEWCVSTDDEGVITGVTIGGRDAWVMLGHAYFDETFSQHFVQYLLDAHARDDTYDMFWEDIFLDHLDVLRMKARRYPRGNIFEFDTLDDLRAFDPTYLDNSRSTILKYLAASLKCQERDIRQIIPIKNGDSHVQGFQFIADGCRYAFRYADSSIKRLDEVLTS
ncbi:MAG TPA: NTP transferase domain-containing protein [Clostridiaceae bacterium]|nr:NTP transferase domain-containing protein [Clostridiaceae bacterium]